MALPTLVKTWQFNVNNVIATSGNVTTDNKALILAVKNGMLGFGSTPWTMRFSCNSVTAGTAGDGVDRWTTTANLVAAAAGIAHSWAVLRQAGTGANVEICIDLNNTTISNTALVFSFGAGFTGGSTTARPTATDEIVLALTSWPTVSGNNRWHLIQSTDGALTRLFVSQGGTPLVNWIIDAVANGVTGWATPILMGINPTNTSPASAAIMFSNTGNYNIRPASTNGAASFACEGNTSGTLIQVGAGSVANELDSNWPMLPLTVFGITGGMRGRLGTMIDLWAGNAPNGSSYPTGVTNQFAQFGNLIVPWNGTVPTL